MYLFSSGTDRFGLVESSPSPTSPPASQPASQPTNSSCQCQCQLQSLSGNACVVQWHDMTWHGIAQAALLHCACTQKRSTFFSPHPPPISNYTRFPICFYFQRYTPPPHFLQLYTTWQVSWIGTGLGGLILPGLGARTRQGRSNRDG